MIDQRTADELAAGSSGVHVVLARVSGVEPVLRAPDTGGLDTGGLDTVSLDAGELARLARLRRPVDQWRFAVAHTLLRSVAGAATGQPPGRVRWATRCAVCGGPHGRPVLASGRPAAPVPDLSLSYAGDLAAVAVSWVGQVGVDVESVAAVAAHDLGQLVGGTDPARAWVRSEAVLKATGDGLTVDPGDLRIGDGTAGPRLVSWRGRPRPDVHLVDLDLGADVEHVGALAVLVASAAAGPGVVLHRLGERPQRPGGA